MLAVNEEICIGSLLTVEELDVEVVVVVVVVVVGGMTMGTLEEDEVLFISGQFSYFLLKPVSQQLPAYRDRASN